MRWAVRGHGLVWLILLCAPLAHARGVYQEPAEFLAEVFQQSPPAPQLMWLSGARRERVGGILGHRPGALRVRYWSRAQRTAWVLDEVGKEQPITVGIVVDAGRIAQLKVLVFRESRGWEVRQPFFTRQFHDVGLTEAGELNRRIDGITGATLSVRALVKLARLALYLHSEAVPARD